MKKLIGMFLLTLLTSCFTNNNTEYKYKVYGSVKTQQGVKGAEWYAKLLYQNGDTLYYKNSDSSIVKIYPPYIIKHLK